MKAVTYEDNWNNALRFFDELFNTDDDGDKQIDKGQAEIEAGDIEHGEADILEGTAAKIREAVDNKEDE